MTLGSGTIDSLWWYWGASAMLLASGLGFLAGYLASRVVERRAEKRSEREWEVLWPRVLEALDQAQRRCALLERFPDARLSVHQLTQFERRQTGLLESLSRLLQRFMQTVRAGTETLPAGTAARHASRDVASPWVMSPVDETTELPDNAAVHANLAQLLERVGKRRENAGLLVVRVDKLTSLVERCGKEVVSRLYHRLIRVVRQTVRATDFVGLLKLDTLVVLFPATDSATGERLARVVRDAVREYHFRAQDSGPEVLLTASFGYTSLQPGELPDQVLTRAAEAVTKSQRKGRNQLHVWAGGEWREV